MGAGDQMGFLEVWLHSGLWAWGIGWAVVVRTLGDLGLFRN